MNSAAETEKEAIAVERVLEYADEPSENDLDTACAAANDEEAPSNSLGKAGRAAHAETGIAEPLLLSINGDSVDASPGRGCVSFVRASVTYPGAVVPALSRFSCELRPGSVTGLCGRTGSGKSTVLAALLRLVPLDAAGGGSIALDGADIRTIPRAALRRSIAVIPQASVF